MLCACSGEQFKFEDAPQSPESLPARDFSICGLSSRTGDWESKFDDSQVEDVESTLKETVSLNYEEARALLGRLEFQRGNLDAALQVFRGIDVAGLKSEMVNVIAEKSTPARSCSKMEILHGTVMSMHSVSLLLEAILLKSKALYGLGYFKEAAEECGVILDIAESAFPCGMTAGVAKVNRLQEKLHQALLLLPEMWKSAGIDFQAVDSYRRILSRPWNLPSEKLAALQRNFAVLLLHGGGELTNLEEALRLLSLLSKKMAAAEIPFDPEVVDQLSFVLTICGKSENLAKILEQAPPGIYARQERWYLLSLCYSAAGEDATALNLLRKVVGPSERRRRSHLPSLLLAARICCRSQELSKEGIFFARAVRCAAGESGSAASRLLALSCAGAARSSSSDLERTMFYEESQRALVESLTIDRDDPEAVLTLARESATRRDRVTALAAAARYVDLVAGSSVRGWEILVHVLASEWNLKHAEDIVDFALEETVRVDQPVLLRMKAALLKLQGNPGQAIETYRQLLTIIRTKSQTLEDYPHSKKEVSDLEALEIDTWLDLAAIYRDLGSWSDSEICLDKARAISSFSPRCWHERGKLLQARGLLGDALSAYLVSSSVDPDQAGPSMAAVLVGQGPRARPVARSLLMNKLRVEPTCHVAWLGLGHVYKEEGSLTQAADCFQAAHELLASSALEGFPLIEK